MNKKEFLRQVAVTANVSVSLAELVLDASAKVAATALASDGEVRLPGMVTVVAKPYAARPGRNPKTGAVANVPAAIRLRAKASTALEQAFAAARQQQG